MSELGDQGWSVVVNGFGGDWPALGRAAHAAFGERSYYVTYLFHSSERETHLPAEVVAELPREAAERVTARLRDGGVDAELLETAAVGGVKHRAREIWPERTVYGWSFTEYAGLVLTTLPLSARTNVTELRARHPGIPDWEVEQFVNHQHPAAGNAPFRETARLTLDVAAELGLALRECYPDRRFLVQVPLGENYVTFFQPGEGSPTAEDPPHRTRLTCVWTDDPGLSWCRACEKPRPFRPRTEPDAELPMLGWAECLECGEELVYERCDLTWEVGPGIEPDFRVGTYVPQPDPDTYVTSGRMLL